jgi:hypothetical protein
LVASSRRIVAATNHDTQGACKVFKTLSAETRKQMIICFCTFVCTSTALAVTLAPLGVG